MNDKRKKPGPAEQRVKIEGMDWADAVGKALQKRPEEKAKSARSKPRKPRKAP